MRFHPRYLHFYPPVHYASPSPLVIRVSTQKASLRPLLAPAAQHEVVLELAVVILRGEHDPPGIHPTA
jgi:hypothetical protein